MNEMKNDHDEPIRTGVRAGDGDGDDGGGAFGTGHAAGSGQMGSGH